MVILFGMFRNMRRREHLKMFYQTAIAGAKAYEFYQGREDKSSCKEVDKLMRKVRDCFTSRVDGIMPPESVDELLEINMQFRRWYDSYRLSNDKSFDHAFRPEEGWRSFLKIQVAQRNFD
ncbi:MAG: hypothetical protein ABJG55_11700 [Paracoccaceae bacterium]